MAYMSHWTARAQDTIHLLEQEASGHLGDNEQIMRGTLQQDSVPLIGLWRLYCPGHATSPRHVLPGHNQHLQSLFKGTTQPQFADFSGSTCDRRATV